MKRNTLLAALTVAAALAAPLAAQAQTSVSEDFTQPNTQQGWWFFNGACLTASNTAGTEPNTGSNGHIPGCVNIQPTYYNENLVGGQQLTNTTPDNAGQGALRFTNGSPGGFSQNGGIVSTQPFPTGQGVSITFKTVTYLGNSLNGHNFGYSDGADGISFFLMDASQLNTATITGVASGNGNGLGSFGGSLGYSCSNANNPYNGLIGGYIGLGIDEFGNFLNGTTITLAETGTTASGDNTATGGGFRPGRIGMRGAGNVAWSTLNGAYGTNPGSNTLPYYPSSLLTSCQISGTNYNPNTGTCQSCGNGTYSGAGNGSCVDICAGGTTYNGGTGQCQSCTNSGTYNNGGNGSCTPESCATAYGAGWAASGGVCKKGGSTKALPTSALSQAGSTTANPSTSPVDARLAVKATCANATLYNYGTPTNPGNAGPTLLTNTANTGSSTATPAIAPILDYAALPGGFVELPTSTLIANEGATTRAQATPIFYQLKISQNGLLSLSYALCPPSSPTGCGAYQQVIKSTNITTANGPLPTNFLFGFAGSTGGGTNIHEILCFKADPATSAAGSAGASEKQSAKLENGIQAYFAYYNPSNGWTGRVTASSLGFDSFGNIIIAGIPNWDASCVLTGGTCSTTGQTGIVPQTPATRTILSWNGSTGIPFAYTSLSTTQQAAITNGDVTTAQCNSTSAYTAADRVNYLAGDRSCEVNTSQVGLFRRRSSVLGDVMDSSPTWVGAPDAPYAAVWRDRINPTDSLSENQASATNTYPAFAGNNQTRTQVVYVGANDGMLHGFRSGFYNLANPVCTGSAPPPTCFTNNDGVEQIAYMPGQVVNTIHSSTANVDYSNSQYGHNYFVDATPYAGDLYFNGQWHTWLVGGLGPGGQAIYALDITNPGTTSTSGSTPGSGANAFVSGGQPNPAVVLGEWNNTSIICVANGSCGNNLGNTYGTPQIRRLHDGNWGIIFGNGFGSASGDAGIYVGVVNPGSGSLTFYYLSTNTGGSNNGIAFVTPVDLDGDHITDYVYAGDLNGNIWRFDLTSANETTWSSTAPFKLFTSQAGQPITTALSVASGAAAPGMQQQLMVIFGTGQRTPQTNTSGAIFASAQQTLYGVWDWNMTAWNSLSTNALYLTLAPTTMGTLGQSNLNGQVASLGSSGDVEIATNATICWYGGTFCAANNTSFGWYMNLPGTNEQIIYNPELVDQAITVNSVVPANNSPTSCSNNNDTGFTYVMNAMTGGAFNEVFLPPTQANNPLVNSTAAYTDTKAIAMQTNATGSSFVTTNGSGISFLVYETNQVQSGNGANGNILQGGTLGLNLPPNTTGHRLSWVELR